MMKDERFAIVKSGWDCGVVCGCVSQSCDIIM